MSSPGPSSGMNNPVQVFEDLWRRLRECHQNALQELEAKVSRLKKERCLDAQRLEVFHSRNQQLKEQNQNLQDALGLLEERLRATGCERCAIAEENLKNDRDQNLDLIARLKSERNGLEDDNRKLRAQLQMLQMSRSEPQQTWTLEQEEGVIPDSPVLPSSLPAANKLRKRRNVVRGGYIRYAEMPLAQSNHSLFGDPNQEPAGAPKNPGGAEVLVPNTCELDASPTSEDVNHHVEAAIAETCDLECPDQKSEMAAGQQSSSKPPWKNDVCLKPYCPSGSTMLVHSPDVTPGMSLSLLPRVKRGSEGGSVHRAKRKKEETEREEQEDDKRGIREGGCTQREGWHTEPEPIKQRVTPLTNQSFPRRPLHSKQVQSAQSASSSQRPNVSGASPAFKKPNGRIRGEKDVVGKKRNLLQDLNASCDQHEAGDADRKPKVEPTWSLDPALNPSMYDSDWRGDEQEEEKEVHGELADSDCTWVSHSMLQCGGGGGWDRTDRVSGLAKKANDSLDLIFDTTAVGEYKSYNSSQLIQSQPCDNDNDKDEEEEEDSERDPHENTPVASKPRHPKFAHVAVVRKKDERRKLKGTTCKECEIYYTHLPEEEKEKKLSACSRHRFLYIPPSTPENFWEVGFPSTQTCIDRGYIKEERSPQVRSRRRQPFNTLFSPKQDS